MANPNEAPLYSENMTMPESLDPIKRTCLGQAHIAGTGPAGATCRQCQKWLRLSEKGDRQPPLYRGSGKGMLYLQPARCTHPILNKADRLVPHKAEACFFFVRSGSPPPPSRRDKRFKPSGEASE